MASEDEERCIIFCIVLSKKELKKAATEPLKRFVAKDAFVRLGKNGTRDFAKQILTLKNGD